MKYLLMRMKVRKSTWPVEMLSIQLESFDLQWVIGGLSTPHHWHVMRCRQFFAFQLPRGGRKFYGRSILAPKRLSEKFNA